MLRNPMILSASLLVVWLGAFFTVEGPSSRAAAQERDEVYVLAAGNSSCQLWTEARARQRAVTSLLSSWLQGYLTGSADRLATVQGRIRITANDTRVAAARREYCEAHPEDKELCTAIALASKPREIMAAVSNSELETWLDKRCAAHPPDTLFDSARALAAELDMYTIAK